MQIDDSLRAVWREMKIHLWGPSGSVIFHIALVLVLLKFAVQGPADKTAKVEVTMMEANATKLDEVEKKVEQEIKKLDEQPKEMDSTQPPSEATSFASDNAADQTGGAGNQETGTGIGSGDPSLQTGFEINTAVKSALVMKGLYSNRTAGGRAGALGRYGGSRSGEDAVLRALRWLKKNQDEDGSWTKADKVDPVAMAGLALLCFLAHNETPSSPEFGATVEKAMKYLVSKQGANGVFGRDYTHGIATYALSEGFALTKIMALKDAMDKGIDYIIKGQQPEGGFNYNYSKGDRWDMSVTGWQFQAIKAARMAGCTDEGLEDAVKKGIQFLKTQAFCQAKGGFGYDGKPGQPGTGAKPSMTGCGCLCLQLMGQPGAAEVKAGLEYLKDFQCQWDASSADPKGGHGKNNVYAWYYITQAKFQRGGTDWESWNKMFSRQLVLGQQKDGHWENGDYGGDVYTTSLCCLMLEVYYRYLPSYQKVEETAPAATPAPAEEVSVKVI